MTQLMFVHKCDGCPYLGMQVTYNVHQDDYTSFIMPDVRCATTNAQLLLVSVNGKSIL